MKSFLSKFIIFLFAFFLWSFIGDFQIEDNLNHKSESLSNKVYPVSNLKIVTWNIRDLGRSKDYDLVAIQEVVAKDPAGAQAVAKMKFSMNQPVADEVYGFFTDKTIFSFF